MSKPTGMPNGRPRALTPEQEVRVYREIAATRLGKRCFAYARLARELHVGVSTLERIVTQHRMRQFEYIVAQYHVEPQNPATGPSP